MAENLGHLHSSIMMCSNCFAFSEEDPCRICSDTKRDKQLICVVEGPGDLMSIEKTGVFKGVYHILHGVLSPMDGIGPELLNVTPLVARINQEDITEVILALTPSVEGDTTSLYLARLLKPFTQVSRIAYGLPVGSELEYADEVTLARALEGRRRME